MTLEPEYKRERGNGSGTETAYTVEARYLPLLMANASSEQHKGTK